MEVALPDMCFSGRSTCTVTAFTRTYQRLDAVPLSFQNSMVFQILNRTANYFATSFPRREALSTNENGLRRKCQTRQPRISRVAHTRRNLLSASLQFPEIGQIKARRYFGRWCEQLTLQVVRCPAP